MTDHHHGRDTRQTPELDLHFLQSTESGSTTRRTTTEVQTADHQSRVSLLHPRARPLTEIFAFSDDPNAFGNIMYDRRVIRGNTYALHTLPAVSLFALASGLLSTSFRRSARSTRSDRSSTSTGGEASRLGSTQSSRTDSNSHSRTRSQPKEHRRSN